jgi:hypothetical protein
LISKLACALLQNYFSKETISLANQYLASRKFQQGFDQKVNHFKALLTRGKSHMAPANQEQILIIKGQII